MPMLIHTGQSAGGGTDPRCRWAREVPSGRPGDSRVEPARWPVLGTVGIDAAKAACHGMADLQGRCPQAPGGVATVQGIDRASWSRERRFLCPVGGTIGGRTASSGTKEAPSPGMGGRTAISAAAPWALTGAITPSATRARATAPTSTLRNLDRERARRHARRRAAEPSCESCRRAAARRHEWKLGPPSYGEVTPALREGPVAPEATELRIWS